MKFSDGYRQMRANMTPHYAAKLHDVEIEADAMTSGGRWTNPLNGKLIQAPRWLRETHDFMSLPLLVRPNSVMAPGSRTGRADYD